MLKAFEYMPVGRSTTIVALLAIEFAESYTHSITKSGGERHEND